MMRTFAAYARERFGPAVFVPAILGLAACALVAAATAFTIAAAVRAMLVTCLLVAQFRIWDDLEDRERDARAHPNRVMVQSAAWPFWSLWLALGLAGASVLHQAGRPAPLLAYALLVVVLFLAYRLARAAVSERLWSRWMLLAKYPAIVAVVALGLGRPAPGRLVVAAAVVFAAAHLYERVHTRTERAEVSR